MQEAEVELVRLRSTEGCSRICLAARVTDLAECHRLEQSTEYLEAGLLDLDVSLQVQQDGQEEDASNKYREECCIVVLLEAQALRGGRWGWR